jgi:uncharacterized protein
MKDKELKDKMVVIVSSTHEPIMVSDKESQLLKQLLENPEVKSISVEDYIASLPEGSNTEALELIDDLILVDEMDDIHHDILMKSIEEKSVLKEAKDKVMAEYIEKWKERELLRNRKGYRTEKNGNIVLIDKKVGRNDPCPCGSTKKFKKCCWNSTKK